MLPLTSHLPDRKKFKKTIRDDPGDLGRDRDWLICCCHIVLWWEHHGEVVPSLFCVFFIFNLTWIQLICTFWNLPLVASNLCTFYFFCISLCFLSGTKFWKIFFLNFVTKFWMYGRFDFFLLSFFSKSCRLPNFLLPICCSLTLLSHIFYISPLFTNAICVTQLESKLFWVQLQIKQNFVS